MKILEIQGQVEGGGSELHTWLLSEGLRKRGHEVVIAVPDNGHPMVDDVRALGFQVEEFRLVPVWRRLLDLPRGFWVRKVVIDNDIDLVHSHLFNADVIGWLGARLSGRPIVTTLHGPTIQPHLKKTPLVRLFLAIFSFFMRRMDGWIAISPFVRRLIANERGLDEAKIDVVYNASDVAKHETVEVDRTAVLAELGVPPDARVIMMVGVLNGTKRPHLFVDLAERLAPRRRDCHFLLVGHGPLEQSVRDRVAKLGLEAQVHVLGHRRDVPQLMHVTDILAFTPRDEGFGRVMTEAMASHVPVVGTHSGAVPDIVLDGVTGRVVGDGDADAMAEACFELLEDEALRARMGRAAYERVVDLFDLDLFVERTERVLLRVREERRRG